MQWCTKRAFVYMYNIRFTERLVGIFLEILVQATMLNHWDSSGRLSSTVKQIWLHGLLRLQRSTNLDFSNYGGPLRLQWSAELHSKAMLWLHGLLRLQRLTTSDFRHYAGPLRLQWSVALHSKAMLWSHTTCAHTLGLSAEHRCTETSAVGWAPQ